MERSTAGRPPRRAPAVVGALLLGVALLWVALFALVPAARADGDPASDYLLSSQVFVGAQVLRHTPQQQQLITTVKAANQAGFQIRVAVISGRYDLGSIEPIWGRPKVYAGFLGVELSLAYHGRLLVVMPQGFGFYWHGHATTYAAAYGSLAKLPIGTGASTLALAAATGVRQLAAARGIHLSSTASSGAIAAPTASGKLGLGSTLLLIAAAAVLLLGLLWMARIRRAAQEPKPPPSPAARPVLRSWVTGVALLAALAVIGTTVAITRVARSNSAQSSVKEKISHRAAPPEQSWAAGARPAPDFVLRDQSGQPVSLREFKGRPVLLTFIDPLCRVFCPLQAQTLNHVVSLMPASQRPTIIAVSVDPQADTQKDLRTDDRRWHLISEWHWAVGSLAQLKAVWKHYQVGVRVVSRRIGGKLVRSITHTAASFVIDSSGDQRGVFLWPFYTPDIQRELRVIRS